ncbi:MAG: FHA domain-containing protein [Verrucomicrobiales bacterium]|jgi:translation initiation factor IF-2
MPNQEFSIIVSMPDQDPSQHKLEGDSVSVGRGPDSGIQILVAEVSVQHGAFEATEEGWKLVDGGSTNGTKVNGAPVGDGVELSPMDRILFGDTIPAYFVPTAVLEATPVEELIGCIDAEKKDAPAPVAEAAPAAAAPAAPVKPAATAPSSGTSTVKLGQVKPGAPVPVAAQTTPAKPAPVALGGAAPGAPKLPPKPGGAPGAPKLPPKPGGAPAAPKLPPKPGK